MAIFQQLIGGGAYNADMKWVPLYALFALTVVSFAQTRVATESGTILVFGLSKSEIVVAADSRNLGDRGEVSDHECKIIALGDRFFFASSGMHKFSIEYGRDFSKRIELMDVYKEARAAFESTPRNSDHFLSDVTTRWAMEVSRRLNKSLETYGNTNVLGKTKQNVVTGLFFGETSTGNFGFYYQDVFRDGSKVAIHRETGTVVLKNEMIYMKSGVFGDTFDEIQAGKTKHAQLEAQPWLIFPSANWNVWKVVRLVQLTLADHPDKVGEPSPVGGPIDSLTLAADGVRWFSRKPDCER